MGDYNRALLPNLGLLRSTNLAAELPAHVVQGERIEQLVSIYHTVDRHVCNRQRRRRVHGLAAVARLRQNESSQTHAESRVLGSRFILIYFI